MESRLPKIGLLACLLFVAVGFLAGYAIGYIPQSNRLKEAQTTGADMKRKLELASLRDRLTLIYLQVQRNNYGNANTQSTQFFNELQKFARSTNEPKMRSDLNSVLVMRDEIIRGLAKVDPRVVPRIQQALWTLHQINLDRAC